MGKTILEIKGGKTKIGQELPPGVYDHFKPLFKALKEYITIVKIEGHWVIIIDRIPPTVLLSLSPELQALYLELLVIGNGGHSPVVHLPTCPFIITAAQP